MYDFKHMRLVPKPRQRVLVTSDIHGHIDHLRAVLQKARFCADDLLIIVGDILEKGPDSLRTLRYVMQLCAEGRAIALIGNVDYWLWEQIEALRSHPENAEAFLRHIRHIRKWKGTCFYDELCREIGKTVDTAAELAATADAVLEHFAAEFDFLRGLPTVLETSKYVFVHGGLYDTELAANYSRPPYELLKFDHFLTDAREKGQRFDKYVVVGHWPAALYHDKIPCFCPIIDEGTRIISIDGGCGIKHDGQLNLLILPTLDCGTSEITHIYHDDLPTVTAKTSQAPSDNSFCIVWGDDKVRLLTADGDMAEIEHIRTARRMWVPAEFLYDDPATLSPGDCTRTKDCTDYRLPVSAGDTLSVVQKTSCGIHAKQNGITGWCMGEVE